MEAQGVHRLEANWLPPVAALAYFEPPTGAYLATTAHSVKPETRIRYGYRVGGLGMLIPQGTGSEVLPVPPISPLPGSPAGFSGLINLRGNLAPLYDLRVILDLQAASKATPLVIIFDQGDDAVAVLIEGNPVPLGEMRQLPLSDFPALPGLLAKHVSAGYVLEDDIWLEFDYRAFFTELCGGTALATT